MSWIGRIDAAWLAPGSARRLGVLRILIGAWVLADLMAEAKTYRRLAYTAPELFRGIGVVSWLEAPLSAPTFLALHTVALVFAWLFVAGVAHRFCAPVFALLVLGLFTYRNSWGMVYHVQNLALLHTMVLAVVPAADELSIDALLARRGPAVLRPWLVASPGARPWSYGWPLRLLSLLTAITYFIAGVAKLGGEAGWRWMLGDNLRDQIVSDALNKELLSLDRRELAYLLYDHGWALTPLTVATLLIELGAPLALCQRRVAWAWAGGALAMHWGVYWMMGIRFHYPMYGIAFASLVPFDVLLDRLLGARAWGRVTALLPARWRAVGQRWLVDAGVLGSPGV